MGRPCAGQIADPAGACECGFPLLCTNESISLLPGPTELTVIRLAEAQFSEHLGNEFYDPHFKHL